MDLLLTHGYFLADDPKELAIMKPYAPLGLLYLSSHLRARGFDVEIYDSTFGSRQELFKLIERERPSTVGIYGNLMTRANVLAIARASRESGCRVVLGGPEPANYPAEYLNAADAIVNGFYGPIPIDGAIFLLQHGRAGSLFMSLRTRQNLPSC